MTKQIRGSQSRQLATPSEIVRFLGIWYDLVRQCITANREFRPPIALGTPKLSSFVTESLAVYLINAGLLRTFLPEVQGAALARGTGDEPDVGLTLAGGATGTLEVKSTGPTTWQRASAKDAAADYFLWINLAPFCQGAGMARVWVLPQPQRYLRQGLDWRSEREFLRHTNDHAMCVEVPMAALLARRAA